MISLQDIVSIAIAESRCFRILVGMVIFKECICKLKSESKKRDTFKNWPLVKDPQFWFYFHESLWKWKTLEVIIFTKFHEDRTRSGDFLQMVNFRMCLVFCYSVWLGAWSYGYPHSKIYIVCPILMKLGENDYFIRWILWPSFMKIGQKMWIFTKSQFLNVSHFLTQFLPQKTQLF